MFKNFELQDNSDVKDEFEEEEQEKLKKGHKLQDNSDVKGELEEIEKLIKGYEIQDDNDNLSSQEDNITLSTEDNWLDGLSIEELEEIKNKMTGVDDQIDVESLKDLFDEELEEIKFRL